MAVVISSSLVLTEPEQFTLNNPIIGYDNVVTASGIFSDSGQDDFPSDNLANPATHQFWRSSNDNEQYVTCFTGRADPLDYVAVAGHNWSSMAYPVSIEGASELNTAEEPEWFELVQDVILPDDGPAIFRFELQSLIAFRIRLQATALPSADPPEAAVVYAGRLLVLQRRIYVGHRPINLARTANIVSPRSTSGQFLGRIVLSEENNTDVAMQNLTPDWVREFLMPFIRASKEAPFFFAWRPEDYPYETGYAWLTSDPQPVNQLPNGMMSVELAMSGVI